jgi:hypothetical protein
LTVVPAVGRLKALTSASVLCKRHGPPLTASDHAPGTGSAEPNQQPSLPLPHDYCGCKVFDYGCTRASHSAAVLTAGAPASGVTPNGAAGQLQHVLQLLQSQQAGWSNRCLELSGVGRGLRYVLLWRACRPALNQASAPPAAGRMPVGTRARNVGVHAQAVAIGNTLQPCMRAAILACLAAAGRLQMKGLGTLPTVERKSTLRINK